MRGLIVGLGSIGRRHAANWTRLGLGEVWVCRSGQGSPTSLQELGVNRGFDDVAEALAAKPDLVLVTNPTSLHMATAQAAVDAGCHVFLEKPLGASLAGVPKLLTTAESQGVRLFVGYNLRFHPGLARLRELLRGGAIGRPLSARAEVGEYLPGWHPWEDYRVGYSARAELGGGPILTLSHDLDSLCWVLGAPTEVTCLTAHASSLEIDTPDVAEIVLRFGSSALGSVHVDYLRRPPRRYLEVVGEGGVLRWEYEENRLLVYAAASNQWRVELGNPRFERNDMFVDELRAVSAGVHGEDFAPVPDGTQGAAILAIALAAERAAAERRTIALDHTEMDGADQATWLNSLNPPPDPRPTSSASTAA